MFILTAKLSKEKIIIAALILAAIICLICVLVANAGNSGDSEQVAKTTISYKNISNNNDRTALLESYGWTVSKEPIETIEVRIPSDSSEVFDKYNEIQMAQGFDLTDYAGKNVKKYTYEITNYPNIEKNVVACILVYKKTVIGGDVTGLESPGFMHGLDFPTSTATEVVNPEGSAVESSVATESMDAAADASVDLSEVADALAEAEMDAVAASTALIPEAPAEGVNPEAKDESKTAAAPREEGVTPEEPAEQPKDSAQSSSLLENLPVSLDTSDSVAASSIVPESAMKE